MEPHLAATRRLAALGTDVADAAADAAHRVAIVVTMVTDTDAVISIADDQGMVAALGLGSIWVQMSTMGVAGIERVAAMVAGERPDVTLLEGIYRGITEASQQLHVSVAHT